MLCIIDAGSREAGGSGDQGVTKLSFCMIEAGRSLNIAAFAVECAVNKWAMQAYCAVPAVLPQQSPALRRDIVILICAPLEVSGGCRRHGGLQRHSQRHGNLVG